MQRFSFNLLPEKPKELVVKEEVRENTSLYIAIFPLVAVLIGIGMMLFNNLIIVKAVVKSKTDKQDSDTQLQGYQQVLIKDMEFAQKTNLLQQPITNDIAPERFFNLSARLVAGLPFPATIQKYGRNEDGSYNILINVNKLENAATAMKAFETDSEVKALNTNSVNTDIVSGNTTVTITFFINEETTQ
jgi:hypothetical protein